MATNFGFDPQRRARAFTLGVLSSREATVNLDLEEVVRRREQSELVKHFGTIDLDPTHDHKAGRHRKLRPLLSVLMIIVWSFSFSTAKAQNASSGDAASGPPSEPSLTSAITHYNETVVAAHKLLLVELQDALTLKTKAGDLDGAIAIRDLRKRIEADGPLLLLPNAVEDSEDDLEGIEGLEVEPREDEPKIDWAAIYRQRGRINNRSLGPVALRTSQEKEGWQRVPESLQRRPGVIYSARNGTDGAVADFTVTRSGYVLLACNFDYQGNSGGEWSEESWGRDDFLKNGWQEIQSGKPDEVLVKGDGRQQVLFCKLVRRGESYRIRCNKYDPPFVIVFR